jgi:hypothetical protein
VYSPDLDIDVAAESIEHPSQAYFGRGAIWRYNKRQHGK